MIWLIGNKGMLGKELSALLESKGMAYTGTDIECDITDYHALETFASGKGIRWIINCSAYTAVDKAEDEEARALVINAEGPRNIARLAHVIGAAMIHISTDYVFDGNASVPYTEDMPVNPAGAYGRTKAAGEKAVITETARHFIFRTAWLYGKHGNNFVHTMIRLFKEKDSLNVVADQYGSPTWAGDLAAAICTVIQRNSDDYGIYHFTGEGKTTWHEFATAIRDIALECGVIEKNIPIHAVTTDQYPTKAKRPAYSVLSKEKFARVFGYAIPGWREPLTAFIKDMAGK